MATKTEAVTNRKGRESISRGPNQGKADSDDRDLKTVQALLTTLANKLKKNDFKPTVGDLIRLLQLRKDLEQGQAKEIKVTWVETEAEKERSSDG